ncbi:MAG TPA: FAD-dependent oxidoreductase [Candidatus Acidoferrales bacterium]|nr:FAD-dependent oxidoreductase [Candidatus Acidoferrales bacterium]
MQTQDGDGAMGLLESAREEMMTVAMMKLKARKEVAEGTMEFLLEKPAGFDFKPGQAMEVKLNNPPETDGEGNSRAFSIASAPYEPDIMFATRMRDTAMKRSLKKIPIGTELEIDGPWGDLKLHTRAARPAVFIAGGIGITPFRSMVMDAAHNKLGHKISLFYSNRRPEDTAFLDDLTRAEKENPNFKLIATMTEMEKSSRPWNGKTGVVTKEMISGALPDLSEPIFYLAGPGGMLTAMQKLLLGAGVNEDDIRAEEFAGY